MTNLNETAAARQPPAQRRRGAGAGDDPAGHAHGEAWPTSCRSGWRRRSTGVTRAQPPRRHARPRRCCAPADRPRAVHGGRSTTSPADVAARPARRAGRRAVRAADPRASTPPGHVAGRRARRPPWSLPPPPAATPAPPRRRREEGAGRRPARRLRRRRRGRGKKAGRQALLTRLTRRVSGGDERRGHDRARQRGAAHVDRRPRRRLDRRRHEARAMPWPSTGEKFPLVTSPTGSPSTSTAHSARGGRRPSVAMPTRWRATPALALGLQRGAGRGTSPCPTPRPNRARPAAA